MFYSWNCSLTGRGANLRGPTDPLDKLRLFSSTQLATFGYTGVPLMSAVIVQGHDRYTGLAIREARKTYGYSRRIDGPADKPTAGGGDRRSGYLRDLRCARQ